MLPSMSNHLPVDREIEVQAKYRLLTELERVNDEYRQLVESLEAVVLRFDHQGRINYSNPCWTEKLGYTPEETLGRTVSHFHSPLEYRDKTWAFPAFSHQKFEITELPLLTKQGRIMWLDGFVVRMGEGEYAAVFHDVTARRDMFVAREEARKALAVQNAALSNAERMKASILAAISHEMRSPLSDTMSALESLSEELYGSLNMRQKLTIRGAYDHCQRLLDIINDLIEMAMVSSADVHLSLGVCQMGALLARAQERSSFGVMMRNQKLVLSCHAPDRLFMADGRRLELALVKLLENASKFSPQGAQLECVGEVNVEKRLVSFAIKDQGVGMTEDEISQIKRLFVQLDRGFDRQFGGLGLGLALAQRICAIHNGSIHVLSLKQSGSTFVIEIPHLEPPAESS